MDEARLSARADALAQLELATAQLREVLPRVRDEQAGHAKHDERRATKNGRLVVFPAEVPLG